MKLTFTNPRRQATFTDWPLGGNKRGTCVFQVEAKDKKGERIARTTTGKPKYSTYANKACIVDGSNGKTYLLFFIAMYTGVHISAADFMDASENDTGLKSSTVYADSSPDLYAQLKKLVDEAK